MTSTTSGALIPVWTAELVPAIIDVGKDSRRLGDAEARELSGGTNAPAWTLQSPATSPPAGIAASMAYEPATGQMDLFGGFTSGTASRFGEAAGSPTA
jgi:hypothetical protein